MTEWTRRSFLGVLASGTAGITLGSLAPHLARGRIDPADLSADHTGIAAERVLSSVCGGCSAGCSVKLRVVEGRLVGVRGNPLCPLGGGGLCARGASEVEAYYDPDRILGPLVRDGERGRDRWKRATWDEALGRAAAQLARSVGAGRGARVGVLLSSARGSLGATVGRALAAIGSPHVYHVDHLRDEAAAAFAALSLGAERPLGYDLETTDLVLSFGSPVLEGWLSPSYVARRFGQGRQRADSRLRLVQVESRLSATGMRADEWVRCAPGTEPLLALAIAGVIVRERLADAAAIESVAGLAPWTGPQGVAHRGLLPLLDYAYAPITVAKETGVQVVDILRLARTFASAASPVAIGEHTAGSAGVFGLGAVHLLNALRGRISAHGGVTAPQPIPLSPLVGPKPLVEGRLDRPPIASVPGTPVWRALGAYAIEGRECPFDVLFLEDGAAMADVVDGDPAHALLAKVPLVVSLSPALDASTAVADVVLPSTSYFEQSLTVEIDAGGFVAVAAARAALPPPVDARSPGQVVAELVGRAGRPLPASTDEEIVSRQLVGLRHARRGMAYGSAFRRGWTEQMEEAGWWTPVAGSDQQFVETILERGGWVDPRLPRAAIGAQQPYAVDPRCRGLELPPKALFAPTSEDDVWLPRLETAGDDDASPAALVLEPFTVGVLRGRGSPNRPSLLEIAAPHVRAAFHPWAELHPTDARRLGVVAGGRVRIASQHGEVVVAARIATGVRPGTVALACAPAAGGAGRYARNWKSGAERLLAGVYGRLVGARTGRGMKVLVAADAGGGT